MSLKQIQQASFASEFKLKDGWKSATTAAAEIGCQPSEVKDRLRFALRDGTVQMDYKPVWDYNLKRAVRQAVFRETPKTAAPAPTKKRSHHKAVAVPA